MTCIIYLRLPESATRTDATQVTETMDSSRLLWLRRSLDFRSQILVTADPVVAAMLFTSTTVPSPPTPTSRI